MPISTPRGRPPNKSAQLSKEWKEWLTHCKGSLPNGVQRIPSLCKPELVPKSWLPAQCQIEMQRQIWRRLKKWLLFCLLSKGREQNRLVTQKLCPLPRGIERCYVSWVLWSKADHIAQSNEVLVFFLFLPYFKTVTTGIWQPSNWVCLSLG